MKDDPIAAHLIPLARTPLGIAIGTGPQRVGIPRSGLLDWIDRTFPADDAHAFIAPVHDLELLARIGWDASLPQRFDEASVVNADDIPDEIAEALAEPPTPLVACAACRRLCVRDDFKRKERQLCAWDYHAQVFGKRGPWHEGIYEARHFETLPACAYVLPDLLTELGAAVLLSAGALSESCAQAIVNALIATEPQRPHMAVKTTSGIVVLREMAAPNESS